MKRLALQNKRVGVLRMAFRARKVFGTFEKRAPGFSFLCLSSPYLMTNERWTKLQRYFIINKRTERQKTDFNLFSMETKPKRVKRKRKLERTLWQNKKKKITRNLSSNWCQFFVHKKNLHAHWLLKTHAPNCIGLKLLSQGHATSLQTSKILSVFLMAIKIVKQHIFSSWRTKLMLILRKDVREKVRKLATMSHQITCSQLDDFYYDNN